MNMTKEYFTSEPTHQSTPLYSKLTNSFCTKQSTRLYSAVTSEDYNLCNIIRSVLGDYDLSPGAQRVLIFLIVSSGRKGYTYLLIDTIAQRVRTCRSQVKLYLRELEHKDRIKVIRRPGRSSVYQIVGIYGKTGEVSRNSDHIKKYILKKKTVSKPDPTPSNVFCDSVHEEQQPEVEETTHHDSNGKICSPDPAVGPQDHSTKKISSEPVIKLKTVDPAPQSQVGPVQKRRQVIRFDLVQEILSLTQDFKSKALWIKLVKHVDPETVCYLISSLRLAMNSGQVESPGRYLVGIARRVCPEIFEIPSKKQALLRQAQHEKAGPLHSKQAQSEPVQTPDFETGLAAIRQIQNLLGKKVA